MTNYNVAIIDYGMGNVRSVANAVEYCGYDAVVTSDQAEIADAAHVILPGVGAFGDAMSNLYERGLVDILQKEILGTGKPMLGICLGMQVLAKSSQEHGSNDGLGWFDAKVKYLKPDDEGLKIPHMGWNNIIRKQDHPIFGKMSDKMLNFYFVHSLYIDCEDEEDVAATSNYGGEFTVSIAKDNIIATQFHPEKSQDSGIEMLTNFLEWDPS